MVPIGFPKLLGVTLLSVTVLCHARTYASMKLCRKWQQQRLRMGLPCTTGLMRKFINDETEGSIVVTKRGA